MRFRIGDDVHVRLLGKGTVRDIRNAQTYVVEIKGASMVVRDDQIEAVETGKPRRRDSVKPSMAAREPQQAMDVSPSIDLHGMTAVEAEQALDRFINDALLGGASHARVIHGRSGGRLKLSVHARLKKIGAVREFRIDPRNPGVTIVSF